MSSDGLSKGVVKMQILYEILHLLNNDLMSFNHTDH